MRNFIPSALARDAVPAFARPSPAAARGAGDIRRTAVRPRWTRYLARLLIWAALSTFAGGLDGGVGHADDADGRADANLPNALPTELNGVGIREKLGATVSVGDLHFRDEDGKPVRLADYFHPGRPVVLILAYFECPSLCTFVLNGAAEAIKKVGQDNHWAPGKQFEVVTISINPRETPALAAQKKVAYLKLLGRPEAGGGWHFLTGEENQIKRVASEIGFGYRYIESDRQYAHGSAIFVLTPEAQISRVLYGIDYPAKDLKLALLEASHGQVGTPLDRIILFCFHYDPKAGKYSLVVSRIMEAACALTVLVIGTYLALFWRRQRQLARRAAEGGPGSA